MDEWFQPSPVKGSSSGSYNRNRNRHNDADDGTGNDDNHARHSLVGLFAPPPVPGTASLEDRTPTTHVSNERTSLLSPTPSSSPLKTTTTTAAAAAAATATAPTPKRGVGDGNGGSIHHDHAIMNAYKNNDNNDRQMSITGLWGGDDGNFFLDSKTLHQGTQAQIHSQSNHRRRHDDPHHRRGSDNEDESCWRSIQKNKYVQAMVQPTTLAGACMFLLYHVVFVLAFGSAMMRPHATTSSSSSSASMLGVMAKLTSVGIMGAGPLYVYRLNHDIPAVYPSVDLFLAPFLAQAAAIVDESLWKQYQEGNNNNTTVSSLSSSSSIIIDSDSNSNSSYPDEIFFGTFAVLCSVGMAMAGIFLWLGSTIKLANLGTYLPYSVLSGFFSAVGVLLWCLAFSVDTNGQTWKTVFFSGDLDMIGNACLHHTPSLIMGILMNKLGPKNPFYVILLIIVTIAVFYIGMWATGSTLHDAQQAGWFWSVDELVYDHRREDSEPDEASTGAMVPPWMLPPAPFGSFAAIAAGHVNWTAVQAGLGNMTALAFLYLLRSSIHASALKKNVSNLVMRVPIKRRKTTIPFDEGEEEEKEESESDEDDRDVTATISTGNKSSNRTQRPSILERVRKTVKIVNMSMRNKQELKRMAESSGILNIFNDKRSQEDELVFEEKRAKAPRRSLESIFSEYSYALFVVAFVGGFGVCPTVATSNTMYAIGADDAAPQYGSILLLVVFYMLDFRMVQYIPKTAFSSLLVLGSVDTLVVWFIQAFHKTQDLSEWMVVPLITAFSLFVGFLNAVFFGIAISMFVFVASFFRVGVVKYNASGLEIRSRIERSVTESAWLSENGDLCQIIVLQNYLFFGNACTILDYIATMFEEVDQTQSQRLDFSIPPFPKILILDLSLVAGMDTSTVDIFAEILEFCKNNDCKLFFCGLSSRLRKGLELGGVKPDTGPRSLSSVRFFSDLDTALGRAEDSLIQTEMSVGTPHNMLPPSRSTDSLDGGRGFQRALQQIDELHGLRFSSSLIKLQPFMQFIELEPGMFLYEKDGGLVKESNRGLFFIEEGLLKIERDSGQSLTLTRTRGGSIGANTSQFTLRNQHARMGSVARRASQVKGGNKFASANLRLARLGPGWVCGTFNYGANVQSYGITIAVTKCRLHHLPVHTLEMIEKEDPALVLTLYKLMTHLRAYREEATIEQLTTLNNIMTSPAHSKPISRAARRAFGP